MEGRGIRQAAEVIESGFVADDGVGRAAAAKKSAAKPSRWSGATIWVRAGS